MSFERLVREIAQGYLSNPRFRPDAIDAIQHAAEDYIIKLFEDTNVLCIHAKRQTITRYDL